MEAVVDVVITTDRLVHYSGWLLLYDDNIGGVGGGVLGVGGWGVGLRWGVGLWRVGIACRWAGREVSTSACSRSRSRLDSHTQLVYIEVNN